MAKRGDPQRWFGRWAKALTVPAILGGVRLLTTRPAAFELLDAAFESGFRAVDTANGYGLEQEKLLGAWVRSRGVASKLTLVAKGGLPAEGKPTTPQTCASDLEASLERWNTDCGTIFLPHRDNLEVPVGEFVDVLSTLVDRGLCNAYGFSNWTFPRIKQAVAYAKRHGKHVASCTSPQFSFLVPRRAVWPGSTSISGRRRARERRWYSDNDVAALPWGVLASGWLSGHPLQDLGYAAYAAEAFESPGNRRKLRAAIDVARRRRTQLTSVAVAYATSQDMTCLPIVRSSDPERLQELAAASRLRLRPKEMALLDG